MEDGSTSRLLFIDVGPKIPIPVIKEERASSPDEKLSDLKKQENPVKLQCGECNYSSYFADRITRHIRRAHRGQNPFQCVMCDYSTYNSTLFREHVFRHQGVKPYKCKYCPYRTVSKKYSKMHENKHGECAKCGFVARNKRELRHHMSESGCTDGKITETYHCKNCDMTYGSRISLRDHKKDHKKCPHCDKRFCTSVLKEHLLAEHGVEKEKVVKTHKKCPHCDKRFCTSVLKEHLLAEHGVEKEKVVKTHKFNCAQCDYKSSWLQKILLHMIHHPEQQLDGKIDVTPLVNAGILTTKTE